MKDILACRDLSLGYEGTTVIEHLNFSVSEGDYVLVVGQNGTGKSTLLKGILGLLKPKTGECLLSGMNHNQIGYLPQQNNIPKDFPASVREVVMSGVLNQQGLYPFYRRKDKQRARDLMEQMEIWEHRCEKFMNLSGGQRQRVLLCRAILATSKVLVLDEPVSGLDPLVTGQMYRLIQDMYQQEKLAVIMITHDLSGGLPFANKVLHMGKKNKYFKTVEEYKESEEYEQMMGGDKA